MMQIYHCDVYHSDEVESHPTDAPKLGALLTFITGTIWMICLRLLGKLHLAHVLAGSSGVSLHQTQANIQ